MSASILFIAAMIFVCWTKNLSRLVAPFLSDKSRRDNVGWDLVHGRANEGEDQLVLAENQNLCHDEAEEVPRHLLHYFVVLENYLLLSTMWIFV
eukprot:9815811-Ditylum_brightwellii.AAC.1